MIPNYQQFVGQADLDQENKRKMRRKLEEETRLKRIRDIINDRSIILSSRKGDK
jgi:hypothetical protein